MQKQIKIQNKIQKQIIIDITTTKNKTKKEKEKKKQNVEISHNSSCQKCPTNSFFEVFLILKKTLGFVPSSINKVLKARLKNR